ncbi:MAG: ABC transporter permease [Colwelliaceae bacterium]|nr:ABC transporter permease [Colwelliaceae bacterium]
MSLYKKAFYQGIGRIFSLPRLSIPLILTLGLTLGAVLSVVAISSSLLYKPLQGVTNESQINTVSYRLAMSEEMVVSYWDFRRLAGIVETFGDLGTWAGLNTEEQVVMINNISYPTSGFNASNTILDVLGTKLLLGNDVKMVDPEKYIWISNSLWQTAFSGKESALGKQISINNQHFIIAGVIEDLMAVDSQTSILQQQTWKIINLDKLHKEPETLNISNTIESLLLKTHNTTIKAPSKEQLDQWLIQYIRKYSSAEVTPFYIKFIEKANILHSISSYRSEILGDTGTLLAGLFLAVIGLLLMATLNLLNLFIAHYQGRTKEFSIQISLGASLLKVKLLVMLENFSSFFLAAITGLLVAGWAIKSLPIIAGDNLPMIDSISIDLTVTAIALITVFILNIIFSYFALVDIDKQALSNNLNSSGKGVQAQSNQNISRALMVFQLAIASLLLTASVMLAMQSYQSVYRDLGYSFDNIYQVSASIEDEAWLEELTDYDKYPKSELKQLKDDVSQFIESTVNGSNVIIAGQGALSDNINIGMFTPEDNADNQIMFQSRHLTPNYFKAFGIEFLAGSNLTTEQIEQSEPRMVIDENMARSLFPQLSLEEIIGKSLKLSNDDEQDPVIINGIVPTTQSRAGGTELIQIPAAYFANLGINQRINFVIKVPSEQEIDHESFINELSQKYPRFSNVRIQSFDDIWQEQTLNQRVSLWIVLTMTALTLLLAAIGVAGLTQMTTNHRKYELAVRMATGAKQIKLVGFILKDALWMLIIGLGLGFIISVFGYEQLQNKFDMLPAFNWLAMSGLDMGLILIVMLSVFIPAWRVISADPMQALREE